MAQVFYASPTNTFTWPNGAIGHCSGGPFDVVGPFAKVRNCPVKGLERRYTCYATGVAETFFSIPGCTRIKGKYVKGFFTLDEDGVTFNPRLKGE